MKTSRISAGRTGPRITNAADKQFTTLEDFREKAEEFFEREAA